MERFPRVLFAQAALPILPPRPQQCDHPCPVPIRLEAAWSGAVVAGFAQYRYAVSRLESGSGIQASAKIFGDDGTVVRRVSANTGSEIRDPLERDVWGDRRRVGGRVIQAMSRPEGRAGQVISSRRSRFAITTVSFAKVGVPQFCSLSRHQVHDRASCVPHDYVLSVTICTVIDSKNPADW